MIAAEAVSFGYRGQPRPVLGGVDFAPRPGELCAISGASGRGKSTLLFLLGLMLRPTSGRVLINGQDASRLSDAARSRLRGQALGFIFQDAALDPTRTVLDNVIESCDYSGASRAAASRRARELLEEVGVSVPASRRPLQISGGQAQRVALCRALLPRPWIILADEPTGNLDPDSAGSVMRRLQAEAATGATVVIATHDPRVLGECTQRVRL